MKNKLLPNKEIRIIILAFMTIALWTSNLKAQSLDFFQSTGKIYVVVGVICIIFIGIVLFLFRLDNKLTKLEKHINNE